MVTLALGDLTDAVGESECREEIGECEFLAHMMIVNDPPAVSKLRKQRFDLIMGQGRDSAAAGDTALAGHPDLRLDRALRTVRAGGCPLPPHPRSDGRSEGLLVDGMLEGFLAIDGDHRHVVRIAPNQLAVVVDIDFLNDDREAEPPHGSLHDPAGLIAEVAVGAGVDRDANRIGHPVIVGLSVLPVEWRPLRPPGFTPTARSRRPKRAQLHWGAAPFERVRLRSGMLVFAAMQTKSTIDLTGKVVLITGASRGIGAECARRMAGAGALVGINYHTSEREASDMAREIGPDRSMIIRADLGNPEDVQAMIEGIVDRFGRIDVLVNNAARFELNPFDGADYAAWQLVWRRTFDVNVFGAANAAYLAMRSMRRQGGGKIINIASRAAFRGEVEFADYGASKAALVNLTRSIARACARDNIVASCVAPGFVDTDMAAGEMKVHGEEILAQIPLGRLATVTDVAAVVLFLASPMADYLNGVTIDVNGGSYLH
jgi:3-oxoacyl-[acyl-carrier protein] reductase